MMLCVKHGVTRMAKAADETEGRKMGDGQYRIRDEAALEAVVGKPMEFLREKVESKLNDGMKEFIAALCRPNPSSFV